MQNEFAHPLQPVISISTSGALVLEFNTNFTRSAKEGDTVYAIARVIHDGKRTMVVESRVIDINGNIMAKARGTFFVTGEYKEDDTDFEKYFADKYADDE